MVVCVTHETSAVGEILEITKCMLVNLSIKSDDEEKVAENLTGINFSKIIRILITIRHYTQVRNAAY